MSEAVSGPSRVLSDAPAPSSAGLMTIALWIIRGLVALVFVGAAIGKIQNPARFAESIQKYQMVPDAITNGMALIIPWVEVFAAALLLAGFLRDGARVALLGLLIVFTIAKIYVEVLGIKITCGCFGGLAAQIDVWLQGVRGIFFNFALIGLLLFEGWRSMVRSAPRPKMAPAV